MPNHYETLGIPKTATEKEIKQAFRALSMKFHPDKVKTKSQEEQNEANQKMQEINSANEVLSDPQQREMYDMEANGNPFGNHPFGNPFASPFAGNQTMHFAPGVNILEMLFGQGGAEMHGMHGIPGMPGMFFQRHIQKPEPIVKVIHITLKQAYTGTSVQVDFERWIQEEELKINENETIHINIPQGIDDNETILIQGSGNIINMGGKSIKGDVHIQIHVSNETEFKRNKNDLFYKKTITLKEALCGFKFKLDHLNGNQLGLNVNIVLFTGAKQVFKNLGMVREGIAGNLVLDFEVKFPETLTPEQKDAISNIL